jgi:hypothetical protein
MLGHGMAEGVYFCEVSNPQLDFYCDTYPKVICQYIYYVPRH